MSHPSLADRVQRAKAMIERELQEYLVRLAPSGEVIDHSGLVGSWSALNADRAARSVYIAVHNAACVFTKVGEDSAAEGLFRTVIKSGHPITAYGNALFTLSCWRSRRNVEEVRTMCRDAELTLEQIQAYVPELREAIDPRGNARPSPRLEPGVSDDRAEN